MMSLEEITLRKLIDINNNKINELQKVKKNHEVTLMDLVLKRDPQAVVCYSCKVTLAVHKCLSCYKPICDDCTGFADTDDMIYACNNC